MITVNSSSNRIAAAIDHIEREHNAAHWRPILEAVRDFGVALCSVPRCREPFAPVRDKPAITVIGDDTGASSGPDAFHRKSLARFVRRCSHAVLVASEPVYTAYAIAATVAAFARHDVIIVETTSHHEADWKKTLDSIKPDLNYVICTVEAAGGVH